MTQPSHGWKIPGGLVRLLEIGWWPRDAATAMGQNVRSLVAEAEVRAFAAEESMIYFFPPPFHTISELLASEERFWTSEMACPGGISFEHTVVIGDFGLGSDAPIVLDYRADAFRPCVLRLQFQFGESRAKNRWVKAAEDFDAMCEILRIDQ